MADEDQPAEVLVFSQEDSVLATSSLDEFAVIRAFLHLAHGEDVVTRLS